MRITIPKNDKQARAMADAATLSGWALAGYVASQVTLQERGSNQHSEAASSSILTPNQFAAKGLRGLRSKDTVRLYAERWRDHVGEPPRPGDVLNLPDMDWPPDDIHRRLDNGVRRAAVEAQAEADGTSKASAIRVAESPQAMAAAIKADPATAEVAARALAESRGLATEPDPDVVRTMNRMDRERDAWEDSANQGEARGSEHETRAMLEIQWLHENGHRNSLVAIRDYVNGLLDLVEAANLTPEMFHE